MQEAMNRCKLVGFFLVVLLNLFYLDNNLSPSTPGQPTSSSSPTALINAQAQTSRFGKDETDGDVLRRTIIKKYCVEQ